MQFLSLVIAAPLALAEEPAEAEPTPISLDIAVAQDEDDEDAPEDSVKSEKEALKSAKETIDTSLPEEGKKKRKQVIKTIQRKTFMKLHRYEIGPAVGFVANDPFLNRYIIGAVGAYHVTEIFAIELQGGYAPILGKGGCDDPDWKPLSCQLLEKNSVSPDISRLTAHGSLGLSFAPIYGKAAVGRGIIGFDIYGSFGIGITQTTDDLYALQKEEDPAAQATENQVHPTTNIGGGARVTFGDTFAMRAEVKSMSYIETVASSTLEMKNNLIIQLSGSFFFPGMK